MKKTTLALATLCGVTGSALAQTDLTYQKPPQEILELADFERAPLLMMDSQLKYLVFNYTNTYKTLEELAQEELRLAGLRINPVTRISSTARYYNKLTFKKLLGDQEIAFEGMPTNAQIANQTWSPDESKIAFTNTTAKGVELWIIDMATGKANLLSQANLNAVIRSPFVWAADSKGLFITVRPKNGDELIKENQVLPTGPTISNSVVGQTAQNITYQDLLQNSTDEKNFDALISSEIYYIDLNGIAKLWAPKDQYAKLALSPDGNYLLIDKIIRPYSYIVPYAKFPVLTEVYTKEGELVKTINQKPLIEHEPRGFMATYTGKRNISWRADQPATLYWAEAQDGGDPAQEVPYRDFVYQWEAPFTNEPSYLTKTINRFGGIDWGKSTLAVLSDFWWDTRNTKTYIFDPTKAQEEPKIIFDRNYQDQYNNPGDFDLVKNKAGRFVLRLEGDHGFLVGQGYRADGQFPFVDQYDFKTLKSNRIFESSYTDKQLNISRIINPKKGEFLVSLQSATEYPNYYIINSKKRIAPIPVTFFKNPFESIAGVYKEVITYKRKDGVELNATLYLPADYNREEKTEKLPMVMWAYPTEYKDKQSAGQSTTNPNEFIYPFYGSPIYWVTRGYAILDNAAFPIVGEDKEEPNDTFLEQLVANAEAAIDAVDAMGYIDRDRVAVGGHSYGAFMTANLLTHSNLFAAGIARSGAYNRTLTPFGFQAEQRNYWDVPQVYNAMSPFMHADKMKTPILLIHGADDNNPGTHTMQSERYFNALKGFGAPARLVLLPKESHGYAAKESVLHVLWEQDCWLENYVKNRHK